MSQSKEQATVESVENKAQEYLKALEKFDREWGFTKVAVPAWKMSQDTGVWSLVLQTQVAQLPKSE